MRITVLGKSPAWQDADGACSGYLVEGGGQTVLLDCGPGVFAKLRGVVAYEDVDAIVISHLHADHVMDLVPFASGIRYRPWEGEPPRPRLYAPPGAPDVFTKLCEGGSMSPDHLELAFELSQYDPAEPLALGDLAVRFQPVPHYIPANAVEFAADGARFTFGADCGPSEALCTFAEGTDLLMLEATLLEPEPPEDRGHLTPFEAGEHAERARAKRLVLTHFAAEAGADWVCSEAARAFGGPVEAAHEGVSFTLEK
ncbi:MBL fold metallo-hydrolase [Solirubrobacter sp. CPCC 204708]|uniref:MBL fold metallo-hydrolase n=1 Tax=Solirubrobacter deserti TaxID=2282478 RepID=A0ABT4RI10_9ACTN|nr:MBL fold metallo-hydrolase [Solirubrobacter deserti]MBE2318772.1 MBL fold metallo-hydrolase [Solirubrobacter deserti]MDA0138152.1 MBL fold metallo-hydrolase [Solirubrobacter deserti]